MLNFSTENPMDEMKSIVTEKHDFEYQEESIIFLFSDFLEYQDHGAKKKNEPFSNGIVCCNLRATDWNLEGKIYASIHEEIEILKLRFYQKQWRISFLLWETKNKKLSNGILQYI